MGGLSIWHLIILLFIVLFVFGPRKLPELGKGLGEAIRGFKKGLDNNEIDVTDVAKRDSLNQSGQPNANPQSTKDRNEA